MLWEHSAATKRSAAGGIPTAWSAEKRNSRLSEGNAAAMSRKSKGGTSSPRAAKAMSLPYRPNSKTLCRKSREGRNPLCPTCALDLSGPRIPCAKDAATALASVLFKDACVCVCVCHPPTWAHPSLCSQDPTEGRCSRRTRRIATSAEQLRSGGCTASSHRRSGRCGRLHHVPTDGRIMKASQGSGNV